MYTIDKTPYGYALSFSGALNADEMRSWLNACREALSAPQTPFGVLIDARELGVIDREVKKLLIAGQHRFRKQGMVRSALVWSDAGTASQFQVLARQSGIIEGERNINAAEPGWEKRALDWVERGIEPDAQPG